MHQNTKGFKNVKLHKQISHKANRRGRPPMRCHIRVLETRRTLQGKRRRFACLIHKVRFSTVEPYQEKLG